MNGVLSSPHCLPWNTILLPAVVWCRITFSCYPTQAKSHYAILVVCWGSVPESAGFTLSQGKNIQRKGYLRFLFPLVDRHYVRGLWYVKDILLWHLVNFIATVLHFIGIPDLTVVFTSNNIGWMSVVDSNASCTLFDDTLNDDIFRNGFCSLECHGFKVIHDSFNN